jgi:hypothetical protein
MGAPSGAERTPVRKSDEMKPKGKPRGRAFPKKEHSVEQTQPAAPEVNDEDLAAIVARQVAARFETMDVEPEPAVIEPPAMRDPGPPARTAAEIDADLRAGMPMLQPQPVAKDPRIDQERLLDALVSEQKEGRKSNGSGKLQLPERRPGESTQSYVERLVDVLAAAEQERRKLVLERRRLKLPIRDIPPVGVYLPTRRDAAAPPPEAQMKDGWWPQWIPTKDIEGKPDPSLMKVQEMRDWDYEVVTDAAGKPIQGRLGVLMQGPPERRAARQAHLTPVGARRPREQEEQFLQQVEDINREHGRRVLTAEDRSGKEQF